MAAVVIDSSVLVAYFNGQDPRHRPVSDWLDRATGRLVTTPLVVAESDAVLGRYGGPETQDLFWENLRSGALRVEWWATAVQDTVAVASAVEGLDLADASLVALAGRLGTTDIGTLDERRFRPVRPLTGEPRFRLLPADGDT